VVAWVFFRASDMTSALTILSKMAAPAHAPLSYREMFAGLMVFGYALVAWFAPNTQTIMGYDHANRRVGEGLIRFEERPGFVYAAAAVLAFGVLGIQQHSEFIYFRF
jgi:hypothetical protein